MPSKNNSQLDLVEALLGPQSESDVLRPMSNSNLADTIRGSAPRSSKAVADNKSFQKDGRGETATPNPGKTGLRVLVSEARRRMAKPADFPSMERVSFEERTPQKHRHGTPVRGHEAISPLNLKTLGFLERFDRLKVAGDTSRSPVKNADTYRTVTPLRERYKTSPIPARGDDSRVQGRAGEEPVRIKQVPARYC